MNIVIVDYGMGNLFSVERALQTIGVERPKTTADPDRLAAADFVILPGVGSFGDGMAGLAAKGMDQALQAHCQSGKYLLGICLGMQMLADESEENPGVAGLGVVSGKVVRISSDKDDGGARKVPYVGWAQMRMNPNRATSQPDIPAQMIDENSFYCVHSFQFQPTDSTHCAAYYDYDGLDVTAAIAKDNIIGTQFHPEKSGQDGLALLRQMLRLAEVKLS